MVPAPASFQRRRNNTHLGAAHVVISTATSPLRARGVKSACVWPATLAPEQRCRAPGPRRAPGPCGANGDPRVCRAPKSSGASQHAGAVNGSAEPPGPRQAAEPRGLPWFCRAPGPSAILQNPQALRGLAAPRGCQRRCRAPRALQGSARAPALCLCPDSLKGAADAKGPVWLCGAPGLCRGADGAPGLCRIAEGRGALQKSFCLN